MSSVCIILRKEFCELATGRSTVITGLLFALFFGGMYSLRLTGEMPLSLDLSLGSLLFFLTMLIGLFMGYTFSSQVFLREKTDSVIETLLCCPAELRDVWLGKTVAVTLFAHLIALGTGVLMSVVTSARFGTLVLPNVEVFVHLLGVLPLVIACLVGALGYVQLLLGMRENRIVGMALFIPIFAGLYGLGYTATGAFVVTWTQVGLIALAAIGVLFVIRWASRFLNRERIVTTLP